MKTPDERRGDKARALSLFDAQQPTWPRLEGHAQYSVRFVTGQVAGQYARDEDLERVVRNWIRDGQDAWLARLRKVVQDAQTFCDCAAQSGPHPPHKVP